MVGHVPRGSCQWMAETRAHATFLDSPCSHPSHCTLSVDERHGAMWTLGEQGKTQSPAASGIITAHSHFLVLTSQHSIFKRLFSYFIFFKMHNFYFKSSELGSILNLMAEKHHCVISSAGNFFFLGGTYFTITGILDLMKYGIFEWISLCQILISYTWYLPS